MPAGDTKACPARSQRGIPIEGPYWHHTLKLLRYPRDRKPRANDEGQGDNAQGPGTTGRDVGSRVQCSGDGTSYLGSLGGNRCTNGQEATGGRAGNITG